MEHEQNHSQQDRLIQLISPMLSPLGYEVVYVEVQTARTKILRVFIDFTEERPGEAVGIEDCVKVTRVLDEPLEQLPEVDSIFKGSYELEVSSPGVDRPLRTQKDYRRFSGHDVRIHVYRPLTAEELENGTYQARNPKQKNFVGRLLKVEGEKVHLALSADGSAPGHHAAEGPKKAQKKAKTRNNAEDPNGISDRLEEV